MVLDPRKTMQVPTLWSAFLHYGEFTEAGEVPVGLVFDHRVMDGHQANRFLQTFVERLATSHL